MYMQNTLINAHRHTNIRLRTRIYTHNINIKAEGKNRIDKSNVVSLYLSIYTHKYMYIYIFKYIFDTAVGI